MTERSDGLVVVGVDDSPGGRAALLFALHDAARRGARLDVVAAFRPPPYGWTPAGLAPPSVAEIHHDVRARTEGIVGEVQQVLAATGVPAPPVAVLAVAGGAGEVLVHAARTADLLVVGSRGRGRLAGATLGSTGLHCVLHARCPVVVVRPAGDRAAALSSSS